MQVKNRMNIVMSPAVDSAASGFQLSRAHKEWGNFMRREILRASTDLCAQGAHAISFQITNGAGQFACVVLAHAPTRAKAQELFEFNWHRIEEAARACLANPFFDGEIKLVMT
ncbi:MAG TPA: hypothetical protein VGC26_01200 [Afipia sp.]